MDVKRTSVMHGGGCMILSLYST